MAFAATRDGYRCRVQFINSTHLYFSRNLSFWIPTLSPTTTALVCVINDSTRFPGSRHQFVCLKPPKGTDAPSALYVLIQTVLERILNIMSVNISPDGRLAVSDGFDETYASGKLRPASV